MKKIIVAIVVGLLIISGCSQSNQGNNNYQLSASEVMSKMDDKESFILYFNSKQCSACMAFNQTYDELRKEYAQYLYTLDVIDEYENNQDDYLKLFEEYTGKISVTPTIIVVVDGSVQQKVVGIQKYSDVENLLKNYKIIK